MEKIYKRIMHTFRMGFLLLISCTITNPSASVTWTEQQKLTADIKAENSSLFGQALALTTTYAVIGAGLQDYAGLNDAGVVYIYKRGAAGWDLYQMIPGLAVGSNFGTAVDISDSLLIVGAPGNDPAAYIYEDNGTAFEFVIKLTAGVNSAYGSTVAIDGNWAVIGDRLCDWGGETTAPEGAVYAYSQADGWAEQILRPVTQGENDLFGANVAISGDTIAVSAPRNDANGYNAGAVYLYTLTGTAWGSGVQHYENLILPYADAKPGDYLGTILDISGKNLITGATGNGGYVVVYRQVGSNWTVDEPLTHSDFSTSQKVGYTAAISDNYAVVGITDSSLAATRAGAFYIFKPAYSRWDFVSSHTVADAAADDSLGSVFALAGDYLLTSAPGALVNGIADAGAAYIFSQQVE